jgi:hypothetical protein
MRRRSLKIYRKQGVQGGGIPSMRRMHSRSQSGNTRGLVPLLCISSVDGTGLEPHRAEAVGLIQILGH